MKKKSEESADAYYDKKPEKVNVYEASEGVKGLTPKLQYTEHKKMSPQEFGQHVKESLARTNAQK